MPPAGSQRGACQTECASLSPVYPQRRILCGSAPQSSSEQSTDASTLTLCNHVFSRNAWRWHGQVSGHRRNERPRSGDGQSRTSLPFRRLMLAPAQISPYAIALASLPLHRHCHHMFRVGTAYQNSLPGSSGHRVLLWQVAHFWCDGLRAGRRLWTVYEQHELRQQPNGPEPSFTRTTGPPTNPRRPEGHGTAKLQLGKEFWHGWGRVCGDRMRD